MKKLISDAGGYQTYVELRPLENPQHQGWVNLRVTSVWQGARSVIEEHVKYELNLDPGAVKNFKDLLNDL